MITTLIETSGQKNLTLHQSVFWKERTHKTESTFGFYSKAESDRAFSPLAEV